MNIKQKELLRRAFAGLVILEEEISRIRGEIFEAMAENET